ncbi:VOC family protein [Aestuariimicrobium soli]|uniref:VOC family protein n=1 Tax=Aestuariimicrobium soli TaxID=2035834 RepID=UPI003EBAB6D6
MSNDTLTGRQFERSPGGEHWRLLGESMAGWFTGTGHAAGAALAADLILRLTDPADLPTIDVRSGGVRVGLPWSPPGFTAAQLEVARFVNGRVAERGLVPEPAGLQDLQLTFDVTDAPSVMSFWQRVLGHRLDPEDLRDPLRVLPPIWFQPQDSPRPLRNRLHLDVISTTDNTTAALAAIADDDTSADPGPYGALVTDPEGNEADLLWREADQDRWRVDGLDLDDWRLVFDAQAWWLATGPEAFARVAELITRAATLADDAGQRLRLTVRAARAKGGCWVVASTGKDLWDAPNPDAPGSIAAVAAGVQAVARELGLESHPERARFMQVGFDVADPAAARRFWCAALAYEPDSRDDVSDIVDPRELGFPLFFQDLDTGDEARLAQRNRIHLDLFLSADEAPRRLAAALEAGGRIVRDRSPFWWTVADPDGNELDLSVNSGREEEWA